MEEGRDWQDHGRMVGKNQGFPLQLPLPPLSPTLLHRTWPFIPFPATLLITTQPGLTMAANLQEEFLCPQTLTL